MTVRSTKSRPFGLYVTGFVGQCKIVWLVDTGAVRNILSYVDCCSESCQQLSLRCVSRGVVAIEPHCEAVIPVHFIQRQSATV